jgi:alpha-ketoglutarate-dependent 2,4-dichlorophenoxyacetate dioxygenase
LVAEHSTWYSRVKGGMDEGLIGEKQVQGMPPTLQPVIRTVPRSNRKTIYVGAHAGRITGMSKEAGAALIDELIEWCTQPKFVYSHKWTEGDLVIWDNRCTLHRARPFPDLKYKRDMRRTTVDEFHPAWARLG